MAALSVLDQTCDIVCRNKKRFNCVKYHFTKTYTISDIESMNGGLFDRAMKCKLCRNTMNRHTKPEHGYSFLFL